MPFQGLLNNVRSLRENLPEIFTDAVLSQANEITRLNRENLSRGELSTGERITPSYSEEYAIRKGFTTPDLFIDGTFYSSIFVTNTNNFGEVFVTSDLVIDGFALADHLQNQYSENIFSINDAQQEQIINERAAETIINTFENGLEL